MHVPITTTVTITIDPEDITKFNEELGNYIDDHVEFLPQDQYTRLDHIWQLLNNVIDQIMKP